YPLALPYLIAGSLATLRAARATDADVLHAHWVVPNAPLGLTTARFRHTPLVITLHGSDAHLARAHPLLGWVAAQCLRRAVAVTACSADLLETGLTLASEAVPAHLIPGGADPVRFGSGDPDRWRNRLGIPVGTPVIAAAGRLVAKKGFEVLLEAFVRLPGQAGPAPALVIGGDGPQRELLTRRALEAGIGDRVRFAGRVPWDEMPHFLAMADVAVVPSVRDPSGNVDGLPTVLLEAMAAGKAVIASRIAGIPLAIDDGAHGLLTPPGVAAALTGALSQVLEDAGLRQRLGRAAQDRVRAELNWDAVAARYVEVYREAMARR
ncbi:MAG: glycosyltransferase, partial [Chloroflexota bacterium]